MKNFTLNEKSLSEIKNKMVYAESYEDFLNKTELNIVKDKFNLNGKYNIKAVVTGLNLHNHRLFNLPETLHEYEKHESKYSSPENSWESYEYGLSDNLSQIVEYIYSEDFEWNIDENETLLVSMTIFEAEYEPDEYGFRFHKWGKYIGIHEDEVDDHEYIKDSNLDYVFAWSIFKLPKKLN